MNISEDTTLEDIINAAPGSIQYLLDKSIRCWACGEPVWGTLKNAAHLKNISGKELAAIVAELNKMAENK